MDFTLKAGQIDALIDALATHADGEDVQVTAQGDGALTLGFSLATITIDTDGGTEEN